MLKLFVLMWALAGFCAALGSILGNAFGKTGLFTGAMVGGIVGVFLTARIASWRRWIGPHRQWPTIIGGTIGFLLASVIAVRTISSPVGPILGASLVGIGAIIGARFSSREQ